MKIVNQSVELLWATKNPEQAIETAGRTCYKSENLITDDSASAFSKKMRELGHYAMIEHAVASFRIITDRGISHEIVRHRLASFAQESTRYCNYGSVKFGNECSFILPPGLNAYQENMWRLACMQTEQTYLEMLDSGVSPQIARSVLPNSLKTELVMMANFREWRHFIQLRGSKAAHPQIRPIAYEIWNNLVCIAPSIFEDIKPNV